MGLMIAIVIVVILIVATLIIVDKNKRQKILRAQREKLDREAREFYQKTK